MSALFGIISSLMFLLGALRLTFGVVNDAKPDFTALYFIASGIFAIAGVLA